MIHNFRVSEFRGKLMRQCPADLSSAQWVKNFLKNSGTSAAYRKLRQISIFAEFFEMKIYTSCHRTFNGEARWLSSLEKKRSWIRIVWKQTFTRVESALSTVKSKNDFANEVWKVPERSHGCPSQPELFLTGAFIEGTKPRHRRS